MESELDQIQDFLQPGVGDLLAPLDIPANPRIEAALSSQIAGLSRSGVPSDDVMRTGLATSGRRAFIASSDTPRSEPIAVSGTQLTLIEEKLGRMEDSIAGLKDDITGAIARDGVETKDLIREIVTSVGILTHDVSRTKQAVSAISTHMTTLINRIAAVEIQLGINAAAESITALHPSRQTAAARDLLEMISRPSEPDPLRPIRGPDARSDALVQASTRTRTAPTLRSRPATSRPSERMT
jgi:hypothetical protein